MIDHNLIRRLFRGVLLGVNGIPKLAAPEDVVSKDSYALTATATDEFHIHLTWDDPSDGMGDFYLERSTDQETWEQATAHLIPAGTDTLTDSTGILPGVTYFYRISVTNFEPSEAASVTTPLYLVAWQNKAFDPPDPDPATSPQVLWIKENYLPGDDVRAADNLLECAGIMQYDINVPKGTGTAGVEALAKAICTAFKSGTALVDNSGGVQLCTVRASNSPEREDAAWYTLPVRISFRAYGTNSEA